MMDANTYYLNQYERKQADPNHDRLAAIQDRIDDLKLEIEELEREYDYIASGDEEEDLRAEAMERVDAQWNTT